MYDKKRIASSGSEQFQSSYLYPHREVLASKGKVTQMRTILNFGGPLDIDGERYKNHNDRWGE